MFSALRAEKRAPKQGVVEAEFLAQGDMPVAFHEADHRTMPENRQDTDNCAEASSVAEESD